MATPLLVPDGAGFKQVKVRLGKSTRLKAASPTVNAPSRPSDLAYKQTGARVVVQDTDRYRRTWWGGRTSGIWTNVNWIKRGAAWAYRQYLKDQSLVFQQKPKAAKRGRGRCLKLQRNATVGVATWGGGPATTAPVSSVPAANHFRWIHLRWQAVLPGR